MSIHANTDPDPAIANSESSITSITTPSKRLLTRSSTVEFKMTADQIAR